MTDGFDYRVDEIRGTAADFTAAAHRFSDAWATLITARAAEGSCWGGDAAGQTFAAGYEPVARAVDSVSGSAAATLERIATDLTRSADAMETTDETGAPIFEGGFR